MFKVNLNNLSGDAVHLLDLLAFLEPSRIHENILKPGAEPIADLDFDFLADEFDFGNAKEVLLEAKLINKEGTDGTLSLHHRVQKAALCRLGDIEKAKYFAVLVKLVSLGFPDTWSKDTGHQKAEWTRCEGYLPDVRSLFTIASDTPAVLASQPDKWADLLLRCTTRSFTQTALDNFTDRKTLAYASAVELLGLMDLDLHRPGNALRSFEVGTALCELEKAEECHKKAIKIRIANNSDRVGNSYSNYAVTLLRLGGADEAKEVLMKCPSLQGNCTDETFLDADNPRFVGDMVLLSRIRKAQGRAEESIRLASKALSWREKTHSDGSFKTCHSAYDVACLLHDVQGKEALAPEALEKVSRTAETLEGGERHAARAEWKISQILRAQGKKALADEHLQIATDFREKVQAW
ncbi:hypothetical protein H2204_006668 [Knufia peltigerae]|uniref:DUF7779 domain-containing protein n=1 Tax=Knufia peltigerae TaxID=1002370 RepID=A0AA38Y3I1_9EURO|nr:hypothetical protein H2204_006668 [Knufia peltigerae]